MHLKLSHFLAIFLSPLVILQCKSQLNSPNRPNERFYSLVNSNFTRLKRQLFREDIPQHRPLSGNHYASQHGFPHPGRWSDGVTSPYKPVPQPNLPKPHQHYIDMLDINAARNGRYNQGIFGGGGNSLVGGGGTSYFNGGTNNNKGASFGGENGGEFDYGGFNEDPHQEYGFPKSKPPKFPSFDYVHPTKDYRPPSHVNVQVHGNRPHKDDPPIYDAPTPPSSKHHHDQEKAIVHFHGIQYSPIINIPEKPQTYGPPPHSPPAHHHQSYNYGPPNHVPSPPLGELEGGFVPSKGIAEHHHRVPINNNEIRPYRFEPFKLFSKPPPATSHQNIEHDGPVAIPILAQFHTAKPIKFTHLKEPIHLIYRHHHHHPPSGPGHRRPHNFYNFGRRPKLPPHEQNRNEWFYSHGL